ncbi:MAG TPA: T9SS type A sorting domain-containing protein [Caldithrix abyssi]|uniref:T9SS type A sorting domain-containing protein n=1 Tax=Caldithrix abyssi TaxID=187145 RepID=A0A7V4WWM1_CALAY|nr:T9SS type A sorting domain-containing protein [Caldithrix abyssi]
MRLLWINFVLFLAFGQFIFATGNTFDSGRGQAPDSSANFSLPLPHLKAPSDNAFDVTTKPLFVWESDNSSDNYRFQLSADSLFGNPLINDTTHLNLFMSPIKLEHYTTYYWRIRAEKANVHGPWTEIRRLTTLRAGPTLLNPVNNKTGIPINSSLKWQNLESAEKYQIHVFDNPEFSQPLYDVVVNEPFAARLPLEIARRYYWRVRAYIDGSWSDWSNTGTFTTEEPEEGWFLVPDMQKPPLKKVFFNDSKIGWAITPQGGVCHTEDGGISWTIQFYDSLRVFNDLYFVSDSNGWVIGEEGIILKTENGGRDWKRQNSKTPNSLSALCFSDARNGWAVGRYGTILLTKDGGRNWQALPPLRDYNYTAVSFCCNDTGWIAGYYINNNFNDPVLLKTTDGGQTWISTQPDQLTTIRDILFVESSHGWMTADNGLLLYSNDGGTSWNEQLHKSGLNLSSLWFSDPISGYVVGSEGTIFRTSDGGISWEKEESGTTENLITLQFVRGGPGWAVTESGRLLKTNTGISPTLIQKTPVTAVTQDFILFQNYPNPFNPTTAIRYQLSAVSDVELTVYNILGQNIQTLVKERQNPGKYQLQWKADNYPSGVYFYRLTVNGSSRMRKMMLLK